MIAFGGVQLAFLCAGLGLVGGHDRRLPAPASDLARPRAGPRHGLIEPLAFGAAAR